jgi:nicotinamidase/pyrazinamidase
MRTLVIVDVQNDFLPGGSLPVPEGDHIVPVINWLAPDFDLIVATQDWHPRDHKSFASNHPHKQAFEKILLNGAEQTLWPHHCVQGTLGAEFPDGLEMNLVSAIFRKGMDPELDSYSAFWDNHHLRSTGLSGYLREKGSKELYFCGLATDICVYYSILDALKEGFDVSLLSEATRPLDQIELARQVKNLQKTGVKIM